MEPGLNLNNVNSEKGINILEFQKLLGSLNIIMEQTRSDVSYAVNALSLHTLSANYEKYNYLKGVLANLKSTID